MDFIIAWKIGVETLWFYLGHLNWLSLFPLSWSPSKNEKASLKPTGEEFLICLFKLFCSSKQLHPLCLQSDFLKSVFFLKDLFRLRGHPWILAVQILNAFHLSPFFVGWKTSLMVSTSKGMIFDLRGKPWSSMVSWQSYHRYKVCFHSGSGIGLRFGPKFGLIQILKFNRIQI